MGGLTSQRRIHTSHTHTFHTHKHTRHLTHTQIYIWHSHVHATHNIASLECPIPQVVVGDGGGFTKRERQAARLHRVSLQRDSVRHNSNCRSPRPRPGRDRRACARRAYGGVGPAPPVGGRPPFSVPSCICLFVFLAHPSLIRFPVGAVSLPPFYLPGAV